MTSYCKESQNIIKMASEVNPTASIYDTVDELAEPINAKVKGEIPLWLNGTLLRNGPGKFEFGETSYNHWFDGQALLHRFSIKQGQVTYYNKFLRSRSFTQNTAEDRITYSEYGTNHLPDPCKNIFSRYFSYYFGDSRITDNALVNVIKMKEKLYAVTETAVLTEIDPESLQVLSRIDVSKEFPGPIRLDAMFAHPHEETDGTVYSYGITHGASPHYNITIVPPQSKEDLEEDTLAGGKVLCSIPQYSSEAYIHSFGMTEHYIVLMENPLLFSIPKVLTRLFFGWNVAECFSWDPNQLSRFHVIEKSTGRRVGIYTTKAMFLFHHINAFETEDEIAVDVCAYKDATVIQKLYLHNLRHNVALSKGTKTGIPQGEFRRYRLPKPDPGTPDESPEVQQLSATGLVDSDYEVLYGSFELPRLNYSKCNGKPYSYVYGITGSEERGFSDGLVKVNTSTKEAKLWGSPGFFASEPVFVPKPGAAKEDEGVVLSAVIDVNEKKTFLLVMDGESFSELGRAEVPFITPATIHGRFLLDQP